MAKVTHIHTCLRSGCLVDINGCQCAAVEDGADCSKRCPECEALDAIDEAEDILDG